MVGEKVKKYLVELMEPAGAPLNELVPVMTFSNDNKYKLYYVMYAGFCNGAKCFRITDNEDEKHVFVIDCRGLTEWVGEIPEDEKMKEEKFLSLLMNRSNCPSPGIPINDLSL